MNRTAAFFLVLFVCGLITVIVLAAVGKIPVKKWLHLDDKSKVATVAVAATPVDCVLSDWSAWSACSADGTMTRTRVPTVQPANGGKACGALLDTMPCQAGGTAAFVLGPVTIPTWANYNAPSFPDKTAQIIWATQNAASTQDDMQPKTFVHVHRNDTGAPISATLNAWVDDVATLSATNASQNVLSPTVVHFADVSKIPVTVPQGDTVFKAVGQNTGGGPSGLILSLVDSTGKVLFNTSGTGWTWVQGSH